MKVERMKEMGARAGMTLGVLGVLGMTSIMLAGSASAAGADPVIGAFDDVEGKIGTYGTAIVGIVVASVLLFLGIKYLRKGGSKA